MNTIFDLRLLLFVFGAVAMLAPGVPAIIQSPYGLQPGELWLAVVYVISATVIALSLCSRILQATLVRPSLSGRLLGLGLVALVPVVWLITVFVPFVLVAMLSAVVSPGAFASHWHLTNKYIQHFITEAIRSHVWLVAPAVVAVWAWLKSSRVRSPHPKNAP